MRPTLHAQCPRARLRRKVQVSCQVVRLRDFRLVGTRVLDLSSRGMLVETDIPVLTGEALLASFHVPGAGRWYDREGMVARVLHGRRQGDTSRALGIAFDGVDPFGELLLCEDLRSAPLAQNRVRVEARKRAPTPLGYNAFAR